MKELGEYLRQTRIDNGVSIEEAAEDNNLSPTELENMEKGNIRAFKDVYKLKEYIKNYSKYLGLDPNEVADEFNEFLFEHTSKISLDDILEAQKKMETDEQKKIRSPYTKEYKDKINYRPFMYITICIVTVMILIYLVLLLLSNDNNHQEILSSNYKEDLYEFTY